MRCTTCSCGGKPCQRANLILFGIGAGIGAVLLAGRAGMLCGTNGPPSAQAQGADAGDDELFASLTGIWSRYEGRSEGDPLRFYYFHGDGKGLYRYGKVGHANTHSFDYAVEGGKLHLKFRKTGAPHEVIAVVHRDEQGTWLSMEGDPEEPGARYRRTGGAISELEGLAAYDGTEVAEEAHGHGVGDRIWIDYQHYATGGAGFRMYQLNAPAVDGRGVGWFHEGDFDDWSTEALSYRIVGDELELYFDLAGEYHASDFRVDEQGEGDDRRRTLVLEDDPRDYWSRHAYQDGGRSFGSVAFDLVAGSADWGASERRPMQAP